MQALRHFLADRIPFFKELSELMTPAADLSADKHLQLLKMTHARLHFSFTLLPFVSTFAVLFYGRDRDALWLGLWAIAYCIAYWFSLARVRRFAQDEQTLPAQEVFAQWFPRLKRVATCHGLALCAPFLLTLHDNSFEFTTLWYFAIAVIVAGNATHQTPVLAVFARFFNSSWNVASALAIFAFPEHWYYIMPMIFTYTIGIARHALTAHKFFLQQVRLEESSMRLAEQFKIAKEAAEDALRTKNRFLATASHDLRQPVHAMNMLVQAISHRNQDASLDPALADLRQSLRAMNLMFNSLLDLTKLEAGNLPVVRSPVDLNALMREIAVMFAPDARDRNLLLRLRLPKEAAVAVTDANLVRQIVLNLMQNALRYTPEGGVLLAVRRRGSHWQVEVCDSGIGVAEEMQTTIYLPYFRHEHAWRIDSEGHGLGLSVVARCALLLKTQVEMKSRLGQGSRFWFRLPVHAAEAIAPPLQIDNASFRSLPHSVLQPLPGGRLLIVEDDPQVSRAWLVLMQSWQVQTRIATNSSEATALLDEGFVPQAVLCDERLRAGESGFDLLKLLLARLPQAHGAMVSGEYNSPALLEAEEQGYLVFRKPVDVELIHGLLHRWLNSHA